MICNVRMCVMLCLYSLLCYVMLCMFDLSVFMNAMFVRTYVMLFCECVGVCMLCMDAMLSYDVCVCCVCALSHIYV